MFSFHKDVDGNFSWEKIRSLSIYFTHFIHILFSTSYSLFLHVHFIYYWFLFSYLAIFLHFSFLRKERRRSSAIFKQRLNSTVLVMFQSFEAAHWRVSNPEAEFLPGWMLPLLLEWIMHIREGAEGRLRFAFHNSKTHLNMLAQNEKIRAHAKFAWGNIFVGKFMRFHLFKGKTSCCKHRNTIIFKWRIAPVSLDVLKRHF